MINIIYHKKGLNSYQFDNKTYTYIIENSLLTIRIFNKIFYFNIK